MIDLTVARIAEIPSVVAIKEATGSMDQASQTLAQTNLTVLSGDDSLTLPLLSMGGSGIVSVVGNIVPGDMLQLQTFGRLSDAERAGYDAPFPSFAYAIAPHVFPAMLPTITDDNVAAWEALGRFDKPFLYLPGNFDPLATVANQNRHVDHVPGAKGRRHDRYDAGHFIQEELGEVMAARMLEFVREGV